MKDINFYIYIHTLTFSYSLLLFRVLFLWLEHCRGFFLLIEKTKNPLLTFSFYYFGKKNSTNKKNYDTKRMKEFLNWIKIIMGSSQWWNERKKITFKTRIKVQNIKVSIRKFILLYHHFLSLPGLMEWIYISVFFFLLQHL